jgi:hypothetical protein
LPTMVIFLGVIVGNKFQFSGNDGKLYSIEISESTLQIAHGILQGIINGYTWENSKFHNLSIAK